MLNKVICDTNIYIYASWGFNPAMELINELRFDPEVELLLPTVIQTELRPFHERIKTWHIRKSSMNLFAIPRKKDSS